ncbi:uncharacterized protein LOC125026218 [Penaeus chinensis]|uniref:uncharacterized protein LOC125026218 n=1 Tax=Penaeus chinensis TaxID=139456 RepID=UPI001FB6EC55|nr:uncharacterized protein LOC125026218 [Penaeus chinensis]
MGKGIDGTVATTEASHSLQVIVEHHREIGHGLLAAYINLKKAFDPVLRESLWEILRLREIPTWVIGLMASLYTNAESAVTCVGDLRRGATLRNIKVTDFDSADNVAILCESLESLVTALNAFSNETNPLGLEISRTKIKIQEFGGLLGESVQLIHVCGENIEVTERSAYCGQSWVGETLGRHKRSWLEQLDQSCREEL